MAPLQLRMPLQRLPSMTFVYGSICGFLLCLAAVHFYSLQERNDAVFNRPGMHESTKNTAFKEQQYLSRSRPERPEDQNYTLRRITDDRPELWRQRSFRKYAAYGFVKFSAYRVTRFRIAVLGLAARRMHGMRRLTFCEWHSARDGKVIRGNLEMLYSGEHHNFIYETVVLNCNLNNKLKEGGGFLKAMIDSEITYLYQESEGTPLDPENGPFKHELAFCGPPMYGDMNERLVREWLEYHFLYMGADHFVFYDAGAVTSEMLHAIDWFMERGLMTLTDFRESNVWDTWAWAQALAIHDCSYRMRPLAKWVFMNDFDEFMQVLPPHTFKDVLSKHEDKAWLTHGCTFFSITHCTEDAATYVGVTVEQMTNGSRDSSKGGMLIAPMQFRWARMYCQNKTVDRALCLDHVGHRKYIVNPRKVKLLAIHVIKETEENAAGVDLHVQEVRHMHFQGLAIRGKVLCNEGVPKEWWYHYRRIADIAGAVTACRNVPNPSECFPRELETAQSHGGPATKETE